MVCFKLYGVYGNMASKQCCISSHFFSSVTNILELNLNSQFRQSYKKQQQEQVKSSQGRRNGKTVGYATTDDATNNECYNEQFLSIKSGCYNGREGTLKADAALALSFVRFSYQFICTEYILT
jgi:hypothetical protein